MRWRLLGLTVMVALFLTRLSELWTAFSAPPTLNIYQLCSYAAGTKTTAIYMNSGTTSSQSHDVFFAGSSQSPVPAPQRPLRSWWR